MHCKPTPLRELSDAYRDPDAIAARWRRNGGEVVWIVGHHAPREMLLAAGLLPIRLVPDHGDYGSSPELTSLKRGLEPRLRRLLVRCLQIPDGDKLLIARSEGACVQLFAMLREIRRIDLARVPEMHFLDLASSDRRSSLRYNVARLTDVRTWLERAGLDTPLDAIRDALAVTDTQSKAFAQLNALRRAGLIAGSEILHIAGTSTILPPAEHIALMMAIEGADEPLPGRRAYLHSSLQESDHLVSRLESEGWLLVGENHGWGENVFHVPHRYPSDGPLETLARRPISVPYGPFASARASAESTLHRARELGVEAILTHYADHDTSTPWELSYLKRQKAIPVLPCDTTESLSAPVARARRSSQRPRKLLKTTVGIGEYQKNWFADIRNRAADGDLIAAVNPDAPLEILRVFDIPYVVNQWWASLVAAKGQAPRYSDLLCARDLPPTLEGYNTMGLAAAFDDNPELSPWGGLPRPGLVQSVNTSDGTWRIFEHWSEATGAVMHAIERNVDPRMNVPKKWWTRLHDHWDEDLEPASLDFVSEEFRLVIERLEQLTGRNFDEGRFRAILTLANEQFEYFKAARDLIANSSKCPVGVVDTLQAAMVPQWHRGSVWARDIAKALYMELAERVAKGDTAVPNERLRLMFVGRGLWNDMTFYHRWEESHGAVFVWSMYLALAADGYLRRFRPDQDPLRSLAARFSTLGDEIRVPGWAGPWYVKEARMHRIDAAIAIGDADPFVIHDLKVAGIPVLELAVDNYFRTVDQERDLDEQVSAFLDSLVR